MGFALISTVLPVWSPPPDVIMRVKPVRRVQMTRLNKCVVPQELNTQSCLFSVRLSVCVFVPCLQLVLNWGTPARFGLDMKAQVNFQWDVTFGASGPLIGS